MVLLVRCSNNTYSLALKSRLSALVNEGLVTAFLRNGEWILPEKTGLRKNVPSQKRKPAPLAAAI